MTPLPDSLVAYRWFSRDLTGNLALDPASLPEGLAEDPAIRAMLARLQASGFSLRPVDLEDNRVFDVIALHPDREHRDVAEEMVVCVFPLHPGDWERATNGLSRNAPHAVSVVMDEIRRHGWPGPLLLVTVVRGASDGHYYAELFPAVLLQEPTGNR